MEGSAAGCARMKLSSFGSGSDSVESSLSPRVVSLGGVDDNGSSMVTLDKSKVR